MKRLLLSGLILIAGASLALAQNPIVTTPYPAPASANYSTTITVTNTFQSVLAANTGSRKGCLIQNSGTNPMYVYFGAIANATIAKSFKITTGQYVNCNMGGVVLQDQVSITGTATETFFAIQQ